MKTSVFLGLKRNNNNKGQFAIEAVLLLTVLVGLFMFVTKLVRDKGMISKLVEKPLTNIAAMTAYGTWKPDGCTAPGKSKVTIGKCHPNSIARSLSSSPNE